MIPFLCPFERLIDPHLMLRIRSDFITNLSDCREYLVRSFLYTTDTVLVFVLELGDSLPPSMLAPGDSAIGRGYRLAKQAAHKKPEAEDAEKEDEGESASGSASDQSDIASTGSSADSDANDSTRPGPTRYAMFVRGCSSKVYNVIKPTEHALYQHFIRAGDPYSDHARRDLDSRAAVRMQKPVFAVGFEGFHWNQNELLNPVDGEEVTDDFYRVEIDEHIEFDYDSESE